MGFLTRLFHPSEQRAHVSADIDWATYLGAASAIPGLPAATVDGAMALPVVYACIRVIAETVAALPLITYRVRPDGGRERATTHPLYTLLRRRPNPEQTAYEFEELMTSHVAAYGNAYAELEINGGGQVVAMWPLPPDAIRVWRRDGELRYSIWVDGREMTIPAWRMHHRRGLSGDGVVGYSPLRVAMLAVQLAMATEEFGARFFSQGARPGFVLAHPGELGDKAYKRLVDNWAKDVAGLSNAHRVKIIEEGMRIERIGIPPEEAQFLQTRTFQAQEIARLYRMPPHKVGLLENATFSNIEHQAIEFVTDTIRPYLVRAEQALLRDLFSPGGGGGVYFEYLVDSLLRGDTATRYAAYATARQWGWLSVNDVRRMENMEPVEGGDAYLQPLNMAPLGEAAEDADEADEEAAPAADGAQRGVTWLAPLVEDAARWLARREAADLRQQGSRVLRNDPGAFGSWLTDFYVELAGAGSQRLAPVASAAARLSGRSEDLLRRGLEAQVWGVCRAARARAALVVDEAGSAGETPAAALERYVGTVEAAGAEYASTALLATLTELIG